MGKRGSSPAMAAAEPRGGQLEEIHKLMEARQFEAAKTKLVELLALKPEDTSLMHNLGVVLTEQCLYAEAEEQFHAAFEHQRKTSKVNYATMYGLATVLTEIGGTNKLLQAEALFRDFLIKAISEEERGLLETFNGFTSLAENLQKQKRWADASEVWGSAVELGSRMYGDDHEKIIAQRALLDRAKRLARWQRYIRAGLWMITLAAPVSAGYAWNRYGGPTFLFGLGSVATAANTTGSQGLPSL